MAKELPFFKFEPNQWDNGNIQICSREDKGLFMDLCSMYWSRLGDVPLKLAINKLCGGNATAFDSLIQENIFTVIDGLICIDFLNEQLQEFDNTSKVNSKNAKDGWIKRRQAKEESERNATASIPQCENDAIREEEKRGEEKKEDDNNTLSSSSNIDFVGLLDFINKTFGKKYRAINDDTKKKYNKLLKTIPKEDIIRAIVNCKNSDFHKESKFRFCTPSYFSRFEIVEKWGTQSVKTETNYNPRG